MLKTLRVSHFAIIDQLEVELGPGFNVVTGETGAGKSILVDALQLVLGGRAQAECVRTGAEEAVIEALFQGDDLDARLEALELPAADGELVVRRVVGRGGRGRVTVNGALCTVAQLARLGRGLIDVSGQHEHVSLLDPAGHLALLDAFAGLEEQAAACRALYAEMEGMARRRERLASDEAERLRRVDFLDFQLREIELVEPRPGEEERLGEERRRLTSAERLRALAEAAGTLLSEGEGAALEAAGRALVKLQEAQTLDPSLGEAMRGVKVGLAELDEASRAVGRYLVGLQAEPERLAVVDERLEALKRLARKHGCSAGELPAKAELMRVELAGLQNHEAERAQLDEDVARAGARALEAARVLSAQRREAAERFARAVRTELAKLAMRQTRLEMALTPNEEGRPVGDGTVRLSARGLEGAELLIGPNAGEALRPLAKIASGGELSRVLLAVKRALAKVDPVPTYVFDEVDAGVGGAVAEAIGWMLREVSAARQVLCITHLPQIAAFADCHLVVRKEVQRGRTASSVIQLQDAGQRQRELARMLAGEEIPAVALAHAAHLLESQSENRRREGGVARKRLRMSI